jgi:lipid A disaccharide synthetase
LSARLLVSCGEPSGDLYAGALTRELRALDPTLTVAGLGGPQLAAAGGELLVDYRGLAVTGFTQVVGALSRLAAARRALVDYARAHRVDALVVIDYSGFNLRLARSIKALGIPVIYYISPQIWAWRAGRLKTIKELCDRVLVIFPLSRRSTSRPACRSSSSGIRSSISSHACHHEMPSCGRSAPIRHDAPSPCCRAVAPANSAASCRISSQPAG